MHQERADRAVLKPSHETVIKYLKHFYSCSQLAWYGITEFKHMNGKSAEEIRCKPLYSTVRLLNTPTKHKFKRLKCWVLYIYTHIS